MLCSVIAANAVPAKRGQWQTVKLDDGSTVRVQLVGDEYMHFLQAEDGTRYTLDSQTGLCSRLSGDALEAGAKRAAARRSAANAGIRRAAARRSKDKGIFQGTKKALVILANFTDTKFRAAHNLDHYKQVVNGINFSDSEYKGSVRDYFRAQGGGAFDIDFDVVGPCPLANNHSYYGRNVSGDDAHAGEMVAEACQWAHKQGVDFSQYDWDGDGAVDQVFVLYAGKGEADGGDDDTIWPHMYSLSESDYGKSLTLDGVTVDTYACSSELNGSGGSSGIGTFCHEFSHCMGFPDLYDPANYNPWFGMGAFDLMDYGSYSGDGFIPVGYSAYEKNECGWIALHDMTDISETVGVDGMKAVSDYGDAYVVKNRGNNDEYYIVEYRRRTNWDADLPDEGVMITHVDYDKDIWSWNVPNMSNGTYYTSDGRRRTNTHQRLTIFHADNRSGSESTALYPYGSNNSLTRSSKPAASLYASDSDGTRYMHVGIKDIAIAADAETASMSLVPPTGGTVDPNPSDGEQVFYESFDNCDGIGGNDGVWNGASTGRGTVVTDVDGWTADNGIYGGSKCVKLGSSKKNGSVTSPVFTLNGSATVTFMAGAWDATNDGTTLYVTVEGDGTLGQTEFAIEKGAWSNLSTTLTASGKVALHFESVRGRFFLDEVKVAATGTSGVCINRVDDAGNRVVGYYTLGGVRLSAPQKGINIVRYSDGTSRKVIR